MAEININSKKAYILRGKERGPKLRKFREKIAKEAGINPDMIEPMEKEKGELKDYQKADSSLKRKRKRGKKKND